MRLGHRWVGRAAGPTAECDTAEAQEENLAVSSCVLQGQRLRRAELGQQHHISGKYLLAYTVEMAWREDGRRLPNGALHQAAPGGEALTRSAS